MYRHIFIFMQKETADQATLLIKEQSFGAANLEVKCGSYIADFELTFETVELIGVESQMELRRQIPHASASFNSPMTRHQPTPRTAAFVEVDW